jgi:hypothetical protein
LQEKGIGSYDELVQKSSAASGEFNQKFKRIKEIEARQKEINDLQYHIGHYGKGQKIYAQYKASGFSQSFFETHRAELTLRKAAKNYFDSLGVKKLPSINQLKQEWATLDAEKKSLYRDYHQLKDRRKELVTAKDNCERLLGINRNAPERDAGREQKRSHAHDR